MNKSERSKVMLFWLTTLEKNLLCSFRLAIYSIALEFTNVEDIGLFWHESIKVFIWKLLQLFLGHQKCFWFFSGRNQTRSRDETSLSFFSSSETRKPSG